jgi:aspartyl-tRNA(Asn)/glutamyl-tRNA(Gln) amidotransferase subunit A
MENLSISQVKKNLADKVFSCRELTEFYLKKIEDRRDLNAFIAVTASEALEQADKVDRQIAQGEALAELAGVPVSIKDIILTKGIKTTAGSKILANYLAAYDATVAERLKQAGVVILGKTNCDEFAMGSSNETSAFGPVKNPWDKSKVPGGSSGGSAAAVAADLGVFSLGTDTGGSVRQPAAFCGVVGLKPTYGLVSRYGLAALTSSLDQAGPLTKTVEDAALVLKSIAGPDNNDATVLDKPAPDYLAWLNKDIKGLRIGLPKEYFSQGASAEVITAIKETIRVMESLGAKITEVSLPHTVYALAVYYIIMPAEASSNLARYDGIRYGHHSEVAKNLYEVYAKSRAEGFGAEVKRRIMIGTYVLSSGYQEAYYLKAKKVQQLITREYQEVFNQVDILLTPTVPTPAFSLGEKFSDPLTMYLSDIYTVSANIAGLCGLSLPAGFSKEGLPIGLQLLGAPFEEGKILQAAYNYQQATAWHQQHPNLL